MKPLSVEMACLFGIQNEIPPRFHKAIYTSDALIAQLQSSIRRITCLLKFIISCFNSFAFFSFGLQICRKQISDITLVKDFFNFIISKSPITFLKLRVSDGRLDWPFFEVLKST